MNLKESLLFISVFKETDKVSSHCFPWDRCVVAWSYWWLNTEIWPCRLVKSWCCQPCGFPATPQPLPRLQPYRPPQSNILKVIPRPRRRLEGPCIFTTVPNCQHLASPTVKSFCVSRWLADYNISYCCFNHVWVLRAAVASSSSSCIVASLYRTKIQSFLIFWITQKTLTV